MRGYSGAIDITSRVHIKTRLTATGWRASGKLHVMPWGEKNAPAEDREQFVNSELKKLLGTTITSVIYSSKDSDEYDIFLLNHQCCMAILSLPERPHDSVSAIHPCPNNSDCMTVLFVRENDTVAIDIIANTAEYEELLDAVEHGETHLTTARDDYIWKK